MKKNKLAVELIIVCVLGFTYLVELVAVFVFLHSFSKSPEYITLFKQESYEEIFSATSDDGEYTVRLCDNALICSNNMDDTKYNDVYCLLNNDISSSNVNEDNITVKWEDNDMKIRFDYEYTNHFNVFDHNIFTVTVPYSEFT